MHACIAINALVNILFFRKTKALIGCFCKLQKVFHHSPSSLVGENFELSLINRKGESILYLIKLRNLCSTFAQQVQGEPCSHILSWGETVQERRSVAKAAISLTPSGKKLIVHLKPPTVKTVELTSFS